MGKLPTRCGQVKIVCRVANKSATSWQQVVVMEFGKRHDTTDTSDFCQSQLVMDLLWTCYGETGAWLLVLKCTAEVVRRLVRHGCDIDARSERNRTALHMAVWNDRPRIVRFLLHSHCCLNVRDRYGDTPLMLSARRGYSEITKVSMPVSIWLVFMTVVLKSVT